MRIQSSHTYQDIISIDNLLEAWREFVKGKRKRKDMQVFERNLMGNIIDLHKELLAGTYEHSNYEAFNIADPKPRNIHKASVRDRLLHHAMYRILYPFFDRTFIADSYSCRKGNGTHKAINRFSAFAYKVSKNHTKTVWVLKCDVKKFFASIDQAILLGTVRKYIPDKKIIALFSEIIGSFHSTEKGKGLPLGNLTSQLLVNIYMNEFDQYMKHKIKATYYIRYADDFVILAGGREGKHWLEKVRKETGVFLEKELRLLFHPKKVFIKTFASGVDFLGWVHFPKHRVLRGATKRRMMRNLNEKAGKPETLQSYLGLLSHGNSYKIIKMLLDK